jgi:hypothetical protein
MPAPQLEVKVETPLKWPPDRPRIRFQDRKNNAAWKLAYSDTLENLKRELHLNKVTFALVTYNSIGSEDGGVAIWLSRKPQDDYGWQDALGFIGTIPSKAEVEHAYREKVRKIHPDGPTPNPTLFMELTNHKLNALRWIRGERMVEPETVMAVDTFREVRHNLNAIKLTLSALRQIERCGSPVMMEQAWRGFRPAIAAHASEDSHVATVA